MAVVGAPAIGLFAFVASCGLAGPKRILVSDGQGENHEKPILTGA